MIAPHQPKVLLLALHGGFQSSEGDTRIPYLSFVEMSRLKDLASDRLQVWLPQATSRRVWGLFGSRATKDMEMLRVGIQYSGASRVIACGFSEGATALVHYSRFIRFDGLVACSAVVPPLDWARWSYWSGGLPEYQGPMNSIFISGWGERQKNRAAAEELQRRFSSLGESVAWYHHGRHEWPGASAGNQAEWNGRILEYFGVEV